MCILFAGADFFKKKNFSDFDARFELEEFSSKIISEPTIDLILSMLQYKPSDRITASDALNHVCFHHKVFSMVQFKLSMKKYLNDLYEIYPLSIQHEIADYEIGDDFYETKKIENEKKHHMNDLLIGQSDFYETKKIENEKKHHMNDLLIGQSDFYEAYKFVKKKTGEVFSEEIFYQNINDYPIGERREALKTLNKMVSVKHPSILKYFEFTKKRKFHHENCLAVLTEFVSQNSLHTILCGQNVGVKFNDTLKLIQIYGIASAMAHLHSLNILHLDLSPQNVLLDENLHPKVANFGMKGVFKGIESIKRVQKLSFYSPPELFIENKYEKSSEVFSFSLIVYQIVTGENPFENVSFADHAMNISSSKRPPLKKGIDNAYRLLIEKCWSQNPKQRPTFKDVVDELRSNKDFITKNVDYKEYKKYVDYVDSKTEAQYSKEQKRGDNYDDKKEKQEKEQNEKHQPIKPEKEEDKKQEKQQPNEEEDKREEEEEEDKREEEEEEVEEEEEEEVEEEEKEEKDKDEKTLSKINTICDDLNKKKVKEIIFEDYKLRKKLFVGGQGIVFKATKNGSRNELFAIKIYKFDISRLKIDNSIVINFKRELIHHSMCLHPSIVKFNGYCYHEFQHRNHRPVMMTEFVPNGNLKDIIKRLQNKEEKKIKGWNDTKKLIIIYGIAASMAYLHSLDIIHRDLKPENILIDKNFFPKLADFGISLKLSDINTEQKEIFGTTKYIAPEIMKYGEICKASDVYSFALIVYDLIMNDFIFDNYSNEYYLYKVCMMNFRPKINEEDVPISYKKLIESCWDDDKLKRPTFNNICNDLRTNTGFITDNIDQKEFHNYVDFIHQQLNH